MREHARKVWLIDGREVLFSYGIIVAAFIPRDYTGSGRDLPGGHIAGYVRTDAWYSVTTSRHANQYAGKDAPVIPDATLRALVAPVTDGRP